MKVLTAYVIAAANAIMRDDTTLSIDELAQQITDKYVRVLSTPLDVDVSDQVTTYSSEVITLGLLWHNYHYAIREGDGHRVLLVWKFLLIVF